MVAFFSFGGSLVRGPIYDTQRMENVLKAECLLASQMNGKPLPEEYGPRCGCVSKISLATRWSSGSSGSNSRVRETLGLGEGGKNEDDEYFDLLPKSHDSLADRASGTRLRARRRTARAPEIRMAAAALFAAPCMGRLCLHKLLHHHRVARTARLCRGQPVFFSSLGPTAYLFFFSPLAEASSPRSTVLGHAIGLICGYAAFALTMSSARLSLARGGKRPDNSGRRPFSLGYGRVHGPISGKSSACGGDNTHCFAWHHLSAQRSRHYRVGSLAAYRAGFAINRLAGLPYPLWREGQTTPGTSSLANSHGAVQLPRQSAQLNPWYCSCRRCVFRRIVRRRRDGPAQRPSRFAELASPPMKDRSAR